MESRDIVACVALAASTAIAGIDLYINGNGTVMTAVVGFWGMVLGYVFGKSTSGTTETTTTKTTA